ncbi:MAG: prolyl oligopeptidase family serine peptidase [Hyphomonadaceae bacterium]|nr:prolyl oligopeptidase family serine peptidase [Hyphomonadaceae bacterium]
MQQVDRRTLLAGAGAAALSACASTPADAPVLPQVPTGGPPVARVAPVSETLWGREIIDPYRWMENDADPEFAPWMRAQAAYARQTLDAMPGLAAMKARVAQLSGEVAFIGPTQRAGASIFYTKRPVGADQFRLYVRDASGVERLLIDPGTLGTAEKHISLDWWLASPSGTHVVYGLSPSGSENSIVHIMEVATGVILPERMDRAQYASPSWLPDGTGFFYNRLAAGAAPDTEAYYKNSVCWLHRLNTPESADVRILSPGQYADVEIEEIAFPGVFTTTGSSYVTAGVFTGVQNEIALYTARLDDLLAGRPGWRRVCTPADKVVGWAQRGDSLYLLTYMNAPRYRVIKVPAHAPNLMRAELIVPQSDRVIAGISPAADGVYVRDLDGGVGRVRRIAPNGTVSEVALPFEGAVTLRTSDAHPGCDILMESWVKPPTLFTYTPTGGQVVDTGIQPQPALDVSAYESARVFATAADGAKIPLSILYKKSIARDGSAPAIVNAYGAYGITQDPVFLPRTIAFLEQGGVLATAHVRGGGEYGRAWHDGGRLLTKPNTWRDLIACCEELIRQGYTRKEKLAIQGGSAGGITVGRALTERPDLFAVVISNVGVSNTLRAEFSQNGPPNIPEFGSVTTEDGFKGLYAMDSTVHVTPGTRYPAVLLTTGMTDPRVEPWQAAKMTAHLQAATSSDNPVLLRIDFDAGHGLGSTRAQRDAEVADTYAFVLWRAGLAGAAGAAQAPTAP